MMLSVEKRGGEDQRTMGEIFYYFVDELADITFNTSMTILMQALLESVIEYFHISPENLEEFMENFIIRLSKHLRKALCYKNAA